MEAQFTLAGITKSTTKYLHVMASLPEDIACDVISDDIDTYESIRSAVLDNLSANKHHLIEQALSALELGDKRPTQLVSEIKRRFSDIGLTADDTIIKSRLHSALVGRDSCPVEQYAKIADSMLAVASRENPFTNISAVASHRQPANPQNLAVRPLHQDQRPRICREGQNMAPLVSLAWKTSKRLAGRTIYPPTNRDPPVRKTYRACVPAEP